MTKENFENHALNTIIIMSIPALLLGPIFILKIARKWYGDFGTGKILKDFAMDFGQHEVVYLITITSFSSGNFVTLLNMLTITVYILSKFVKILFFDNDEQSEKIMRAAVHTLGFLNVCCSVINNMATI